MKVFPDSLFKLPVNASYRVEQGRASVSVVNLGKNEYEITANCDSVNLLVTDLYTEIYHLNKEKTELQDKLSVQEISVVREPNGFQWFQIWTGRILGGLFLLLVIFKYVVRKSFI